MKLSETRLLTSVPHGAFVRRQLELTIALTIFLWLGFPFLLFNGIFTLLFLDFFEIWGLYGALEINFVRLAWLSSRHSWFRTHPLQMRLAIFKSGIILLVANKTLPSFQSYQTWDIALKSCCLKDAARIIIFQFTLFYFWEINISSWTNPIRKENRPFSSFSKNCSFHQRLPSTERLRILSLESLLTFRSTKVNV